MLLEGLPGSGKTTLAEALWKQLGEQGVSSRWWREEFADHPATPRSLRRTASQPGFAGRCIEHWRRFVDHTLAGDSLPILEGSAFQTTIRYMLEYGTPRDEILHYVAEFDRAVATLSPRFVYLTTADPSRHLTDVVYPERGEAWVTKVARYLAGTPCCRKRGWSGAEGMTRFWLRYRALCDEAVAVLCMPVLHLEVGPGHWPETQTHAFEWLSAAEPALDT